MLAGAVAEMLTIGAALSFLLLLGGTPGFALPAPIRAALDMTGLGTMVAASLILITAAVAAAVLRLWLVWLTGQFVAAVGSDIATGIFSRTLRQPYASFVRQSSSDVIAGVVKVQILVSGVLLPVMQVVVGLVVGLAIAGLLFAIHPTVATIVALLVGAAYVLVSVATRKRLLRNAAVVSSTATIR